MMIRRAIIWKGTWSWSEGDLTNQRISRQTSPAPPPNRLFVIAQILGDT